MNKEVFQSGPFRGVSVTDKFALAAQSESPIVVKLPAVAWPSGKNPVAADLGSYAPGETIAEAVVADADVLVILYTELEIEAFLEVFTGDSTWDSTRQGTWNLYAHNFSSLRHRINSVSGDPALEAGGFGYLSAIQVGQTKVVLFKSDLHPKVNGPGLPFIPVVAQLVSELQPKLVISTGTAGAIGPNLNCGDVVVVEGARFHLQETYPDYPALKTMSDTQAELTSPKAIDATFVAYAASNFTKLSLPGLGQCHAKFSGQAKYAFLKPNAAPPAIYVAGVNPVPGVEPMDVVSADYLTVDDNNDSEGLQALGVMNETDDAFAFYAISTLPAAQQPKWLSIRNASEPQMVVKPFPQGTSETTVVDDLKSLAGSIYGVYQYCTTLNSAFACWGVIAGL